MRYLLCFFIFLFINNNIFSQNSCFLEFEVTDSVTDLKLKKTLQKPIKIDSLKIEKRIQKELYNLRNIGFIESSCDSTIWNNKKCVAYIHAGKKYKWLKLSKGNVDEAALSESGYREKIYNNAIFKEKQTADLFKKIIRYYEETGYPFASIKMDSLIFDNNISSGKLYITKNKKTTIDSIVYDKSLKLSSSYLYSYIGLKPGSLYQESKMKQVKNRLDELPFITLSAAPQLVITDKYTKLNLFIKNKKANQFDGILGILPNDVTGKILFTGQVKLKLENSIGKGELLDVDWRKLQFQTQDLKAKVIYPFVLKTPFGIDANIKLYKRDTTFIDVQLNGGIQYLLSGGNYFKVFVNNRNTNLISTSQLKFATKLPDYTDVKIYSYGIGFKYEKTDYRLNPSKGFSLIANTSAGNKIITINPNIPEKLYDGIVLKTAQYQFDFSGAIYLPVSKRNVISITNKTAGIFGKSMFQNEVFRIGGIATLKGFDEESIFASSYSISALEYRFLLDRNSYFFGFFNAAYYEKRIINEFVHDTPYGFGTGLSFETKAGIFNITYALGKQFDNPILLRAAKIHFGIISVF